MLSDKKILITGATGQIAGPMAKHLVANNEVWCAARFTKPELKAEIEELGIVAAPWTLGTGDFSTLPDDFTHVIHAAGLFITPDHDEVVQVNAEGTGMLMAHCRTADAFLFVSSFCLYSRQEPEHAYAETDPLGGYATYGASYPVSKIATEGAVRSAARILELPTTIARMNIGYGTSGHGGLPVMYFQMLLDGKPIPVPIGYDNWGSPIAEQDIAAQADGPLFDIASVPATIVNWAGDDAITDRQTCDYLAELAGVTPNYLESEVSYDSFISDNTRREQLIGKCETNWKVGMRQAIETRFPGKVTAP